MIISIMILLPSHSSSVIKPSKTMKLHKEVFPHFLVFFHTPLQTAQLWGSRVDTDVLACFLLVLFYLIVDIVNKSNLSKIVYIMI